MPRNWMVHMSDKISIPNFGSFFQEVNTPFATNRRANLIHQCIQFPVSNIEQRMIDATPGRWYGSVRGVISTDSCDVYRGSSAIASACRRILTRLLSGITGLTGSAIRVAATLRCLVLFLQLGLLRHFASIEPFASLATLTSHLRPIGRHVETSITTTNVNTKGEAVGWLH
jgi:hypothetical protein